MTKVQTVLGIAISLLLIFSAGFGAVSYFATSAEVQVLSMKVDYGFLEARSNDLQKRMWAIEDRYGEDKSKWTKSALKDWKKYKVEYDAIMKKLEIIFQQQQKKGS